MNATQFLLETFQNLLGDKYILYPNHTFQKKFINPLHTPYGTQYDVNYQAFAEYADKIVGVVDCRPDGQNSTPYYLANATYIVSFWVPVDCAPLNVIDAPSFSFYDDMAALAAAVSNHEFRLDGKRGFFSIGEPYLASTQSEKTGSYARIVMQISGSVTVSDEAVGMGADVEVALVIDGQEYVFENPTNLTIASPTGANANQYTDSAKTELDVATVEQSLSFVIDDWGEEDNKAVALVRDKAFKSLEELTPDAAEESEKLEVPVVVYKAVRSRGADGATVAAKQKMAGFWGVLEAQYAVSGKTGFGKYTVNIQNAQRRAGDGI